MKRKEGESARERLKRALDLEGLSYLGDLLEMRGTQELDARGCEGILLYSETCIKLSMKKYVLNIEGEGLFCSSYLAYTVRVRGEIASLRFEKRGIKNEEKK